MKSISAIVLLAGFAAAYPGEVLRKRALAPREGCPGTLTTGQYEYPHYITQISKSQPDKAFGPQLNGVFTPNDIASIFSFDVPAERADANCTLEFFFVSCSNFPRHCVGARANKGNSPPSQNCKHPTSNTPVAARSSSLATTPAAARDLRQRGTTSLLLVLSRLSHRSTWNPATPTPSMSVPASSALALVSPA
jgi:hypothetical protein